MPQAFAVACPACACVCDDLTLTIENERIVEVSPRCPLAERWFFDHSGSQRPAVEIGREPASFEAAIQYSADILRRANYPLIYGLARSSTPGQRAAIELTEQLGGVIDTTASLCHGPSILAKQSEGESTCTLGEVRNRCDLVVFWGCNPAETHPRHAERYSVFPRGRFVPGGRSGRTVVMIGNAQQVHDWCLDREGARPDVVVPIAPGRDFEALSALRAIIKGVSLQTTVEATQFGEATDCGTGASWADLCWLADRLKSCRNGIVFFGLGLTETAIDRPTMSPPMGHVNVACLLRLVAELNAFTRFFARRMRMQGDVSGADTVLCWQTGYPFSVEFSRGYPRYNPGEFSANDLLSRGEVDACLFVGAETVPAFSPQAQRQLHRIPTIVLDYPAAESCFTPTVRFTTAPYGLSAPGSIYRMDEVPMTLRKHISLPWPTDEFVIRRLMAMVGSVRETDEVRYG